MEKKVFLLLMLIKSLAFCIDLPQSVIYVHPQPNAIDVSYKTNLIFRFLPSIRELVTDSDVKLTVIGEKSGLHSGSQFFSDNNLLFYPDVAFTPGEKITVSLDTPTLKWETPLAFSFWVNNTCKTDKAPASQPRQPTPPRIIAENVNVINGVSVPSDFPHFVQHEIKEGASPFKVFITNELGAPYLMIFEPDGTPYFYQRLPRTSQDFKIQPNGQLSRFEQNSDGRYAVMDSSCNVLKYLQCGNGYNTDRHELLMLPNGHYFMIGTQRRTIDLSELVTNGRKEAVVLENHVLEFDENGHVIFDWSSKDHYNVQDAMNYNFKMWVIDYVHLNSIAVDYDDNIIISARHLSEVTKINRQTGVIMWRFGGENNQFNFLNDPLQLSYQHDARPVEGKPNHYTIFDNGNYSHNTFSRAVEYKIDPILKTAVKVWEYKYDDGIARSMGNAQRLPNGNTFINWSGEYLPKAYEVTPGGKTVYSADFSNTNAVYRTFKFDWNRVYEKPYLLSENSYDGVNLIFNKFGDKNVKSFEIYAGKPGWSLSKVAETNDTFFKLTNRELEHNNEYLVQVMAVLNDGTRSVGSNIDTVTFEYVELNENLVQNGDFDNGKNLWDFGLQSSAQAQFQVDQLGQMCIDIASGGTREEDVHVLQRPIPMLKNLSYTLEFDAYSDSIRPFMAKVMKDEYPNTDYSKISTVMLTTRKRHFKFDFTMEELSDTKARLMFCAGGSGKRVYLDNISLHASQILGIEHYEFEPKDFYLEQNYPNPFNPVTTIGYELSEPAYVSVEIYNLRGEQMTSLVNSTQHRGFYQIKVDASDWASGVYFYQLKISKAGKVQTYGLKKMMVIK